MELSRICIVPTGDEIKNGVVKDLDSPEIMGLALAAFPRAQVVRVPPVVDVEEEILDVIGRMQRGGADLIVLIGGSGGGHRFSASLGKDYTHSALGRFLDDYASHEIYGKNGHMWSKLMAGKKGGAVLINVPGPYVEAKAAFEAFLRGFRSGSGFREISRAMAEAVLAQYPDRGARVQ